MGKQRFRSVRQGKTHDEISASKHLSKKGDYASAGLKIKAFLTDAFMLLMPIMYIVFYVLMDGREDFAAHKMLGWFAILLPLAIAQTLFMYLTGQTPGYRAYRITLIDENTKEKPSLFVIIFRNLAAILSLFTLVGWALMFFRKDNKTLHDLLSATAVVNKK
ncbi:RDD family protein [Sulfurovum sp.]|uniref:RDD family protein n=1 Tax=Sulfurovum sp. TaxID=1969726 RepID=UPI002867B3BE|nr:RDD family protein [Sulfurovum sp.]